VHKASWYGFCQRFKVGDKYNTTGHKGRLFERTAGIALTSRIDIDIDRIAGSYRDEAEAKPTWVRPGCQVPLQSGSLPIAAQSRAVGVGSSAIEVSYQRPYLLTAGIARGLAGGARQTKTHDLPHDRLPRVKTSGG